MVIALIGRTGAGKNTVAEYCHVFGINKVTELPENQEDDCVMVINPDEITDLRRRVSDVIFIYLEVSMETAMIRMLKRGDPTEAILEIATKDNETYPAFALECDYVIDCEDKSVHEITSKIYFILNVFKRNKRRTPKNNFLLTSSEIKEIAEYHEHQKLLQEARVQVCSYINAFIPANLEPNSKKNWSLANGYLETYHLSYRVEDLFQETFLERLVSAYEHENRKIWKTVIENACGSF